MKELVSLLKKLNLTLASCESVTGGDFASAMTDVSGASEVYLGGLIVYSDYAKIRLAGVDETILSVNGSVSEETVLQMAVRTQTLLKSDLSVAFSGNAGPKASSNQPVGRVFTAIAIYDKCYTYKDDLTGSRIEIKNQIVQLASRRLLDLIDKEIMRKSQIG